MVVLRIKTMNIEQINELILGKACRLDSDGYFSIDIDFEELAICASGSIYRQFENDKCGDEPDCYRLVSREVLFSEICVNGPESEYYFSNKQIYDLQELCRF